MAHRVNARAAMTPARKKRIAGVLSRARDLMNDSGRHWIQGQLQGMKNGEKAYCSIGAIYASTKSETLRQEAVQVLEDELPGVTLTVSSERQSQVWKIRKEVNNDP